MKNRDDKIHGKVLTTVWVQLNTGIKQMWVLIVFVIFVSLKVQHDRFYHFDTFLYIDLNIDF